MPDPTTGLGFEDPSPAQSSPGPAALGKLPPGPRAPAGSRVPKKAPAAPGPQVPTDTQSSHGRGRCFHRLRAATGWTRWAEDHGVQEPGLAEPANPGRSNVEADKARPAPPRGQPLPVTVTLPLLLT